MEVIGRQPDAEAKVRGVLLLSVSVVGSAGGIIPSGVVTHYLRYVMLAWMPLCLTAGPLRISLLTRFDWRGHCRVGYNPSSVIANHIAAPEGLENGFLRRRIA